MVIIANVLLNVIILRKILLREEKRRYETGGERTDVILL